MPLALRDLVDAVHRRYPPATAESWDAVGLVVGDPLTEIRRVHLAVDPTAEVVAEALDLGADLLWVHHPLFLRGTTTVAADTDKGRIVHRLIAGGCALLTSHTNADIAVDGVSQALADRLGLTDQRPLVPSASGASDDAAAPATLVVHVPTTHTESLLDALAAAGAGRQGDYERAAFSVTGTGTFRPLDGARPAIGEIGTVERVVEDRLELLVPAGSEQAVVAARRPGHGRIGVLPEPVALGDFARLVADRLPATPAGITVGGDLDAPVRTVAVSGGSGDVFLADARRAGADAYVTADLRHHPASEHLAGGTPYLIGATHWATERPWLDVAADRLREDAAAAGAPLDMTVSDLVTDPWVRRLGAASAPGASAEADHPLPTPSDRPAEGN
jgi:dinuclear metal center YbgI/SA1388 family protein